MQPTWLYEFKPFFLFLIASWTLSVLESPMKWIVFGSLSIASLVIMYWRIRNRTS